MSSSNAITKSPFTPWKLGSVKWFKFGYCGSSSGLGKYLFQLIVLLKPDFNSSNDFALSCVDKVTTGT